MDNGKAFQVNSRSSRLRRLSLIIAGIGVGSALAYLITRIREGREGTLSQRRVPEHIVDDRGTGQDKAAQLLKRLRDRGFEASDEKLALALGRPMEEVAAWNAGLQIIDDDVVMKARGIALNRGVRIE